MSLKNLLNAKDPLTHALKTIDSDHYYIHHGLMYSYSEYFTLTTGTSRFIAFKTPASLYDIHYRLTQLDASADKARVNLYEGSVITGGSDKLTSLFNHNRQTSKTSAMQSFVSGTAHSTPGTLILYGYVPGGTSVGQSRNGASTGQRNEWVLDRDTIYVVEIINGSSGDNIINIVINWYEETAYNFS